MVALCNDLLSEDVMAINKITHLYHLYTDLSIQPSVSVAQFSCGQKSACLPAFIMIQSQSGPHVHLYREANP